ncbi:hypothetical protein RDI58_024174 [Solanum bulbocastanum]|uniref:Uncharacterized protein n=1 Tax=Solanum bulbocastanum TaxID=147425 RepID=A0AAN8T182_SOLBU
MMVFFTNFCLASDFTRFIIAIISSGRFLRMHFFIILRQSSKSIISANVFSYLSLYSTFMVHLIGSWFFYIDRFPVSLNYSSPTCCKFVSLFFIVATFLLLYYILIIIYFNLPQFRMQASARFLLMTLHFTLFTIFGQHIILNLNSFHSSLHCHFVNDLHFHIFRKIK